MGGWGLDHSTLRVGRAPTRGGRGLGADGRGRPAATRGRAGGQRGGGGRGARTRAEARRPTRGASPEGPGGAPCARGTDSRPVGNEMAVCRAGFGWACGTSSFPKDADGWSFRPAVSSFSKGRVQEKKTKKSEVHIFGEKGSARCRPRSGGPTRQIRPTADAEGLMGRKGRSVGQLRLLPKAVSVMKHPHRPIAGTGTSGAPIPAA